MQAEDFFKELIKYRTENKVVTFYDQYAEYYDEAVTTVNYDKLADYCGEFLCRFITENSTTSVSECEVVDIGCGSGMSGFGLKNSGFQRIDGLDPSTGLLEIARQKDIYRNLIEGKISDGGTTPVTSNKYDCLTCIGCITINHIDINEALPEFFRLLKNGGIAVYTVSPSLNKTEALEKHLPYFASNQFQLLCIERKHFRKRLANKLKDDFSHLYAIMKCT